MSKEPEQLPLQEFINKNCLVSSKGQDVARFWNKGSKVKFGPQGTAVLNVLLQNMAIWIENWSDPEKCEGIKSQLNDLKAQAAQDFEELSISAEINKEDLESGYMFAIFSQTQNRPEVVNVQSPSNDRYLINQDSNKQIRAFLDGGEEGLQNYLINQKLKPINGPIAILRNYSKTLPDVGAGSEKKQAIIELEKKIRAVAGDIEAIQVLVNNALKSEYHHFHQTNKLLVNRGFHLYWLHSLFQRKMKINPVTGRLSRSTTEDRLIELKESVDAIVEKAKKTEEPGVDSSSSNISID